MYETFEAELDQLWGIIQRRIANHVRPKISKDRLRELALEGLRNKQPLKDLMGFGPDWRSEFRISGSDLLPRNDYYIIFNHFAARGFVRDLPPRDDDGRDWLAMIGENKITLDRRTQKMSRWLARQIDPAQWNDHVRRSFSDRPANERSWETFSALLFEAASSLQRKMIVSLNPLDMILSAECSGYRSCHSLDGAHANGNVAYARDHQTGIGFVVDESPAHPQSYPYQKLGRVWFYVDTATNKKLIVGKTYGTINQSQARAVSSHLTRLLSTGLQVPYDWRGKTGLTYPHAKLRNCGHNQMSNHESLPVYFDLAISRMTYHNSYRAENPALTALDLAWQLSFQDSRCLGCGDTTRYNKHLICDSCERAAVSCVACSRRVDLRGGAWNWTSDTGELFCSEQCRASRYHHCASCDAWKASTEEHHDAHGDTVCHACYTERYDTCGACSNAAHRDYFQTWEGERVCQSCHYSRLMASRRAEQQAARERELAARRSAEAAARESMRLAASTVTVAPAVTFAAPALLADTTMADNLERELLGSVAVHGDETLFRDAPDPTLLSELETYGNALALSATAPQREADEIAH